MLAPLIFSRPGLDPTNPQILKTITPLFTATVNDAVINGAYIYAVSLDALTIGGDLSVFRTAGGTLSQEFYGVTDSTDMPYGVCVAGNYLFVTEENGTSGAGAYEKVLAYSISTPDTPSYVGQVSTTLADSAIRGIVASGNYLFACHRTDNAITVVDKSSPSSMSVEQTFTDGTNLVSPDYLAVSGNYLYVACTSTLTVIDISSPTSISYAGKVSTSAAPNGKPVIDGNYCYVPVVGGFDVIDISTPTSPAVNNSQSGPTTSLAVSGNYLYGVQANEVRIWDISDPTSPSNLGVTDGLTNVDFVLTAESGSPVSISQTECAVVG